MNRKEYKRLYEQKRRADKVYYEKILLKKRTLYKTNKLNMPIEKKEALAKKNALYKKQYHAKKRDEKLKLKELQ